MERIAIERVTARKCSVENRPYGGEAQVASTAGRPLLKFMRHPRAQSHWKLERHGDLGWYQPAFVVIIRALGAVALPVILA
jgi:hypothetical protein